MKISRTRIAALGAAAILMLGGATVALAQSPSPKVAVTVPAAAADSVRLSDADTIEDPAGAPDTDNVESGDQTGPDAANEPAETGSESSAEADGPGGHADADGQNVDHQFDGEE